VSSRRYFQGADLLRNFEAADVRQDDVEQHQVGPLARKGVRALSPLSAGMAVAPKCLTYWSSTARLERLSSTTRIFMAAGDGERSVQSNGNID
jgi:hypothetical protein